jgi:hypothetical protein
VTAVVRLNHIEPVAASHSPLAADGQGQLVLLLLEFGNPAV